MSAILLTVLPVFGLIAMGYVATPLAEVGTALKLEQRGKLFDAKVAAMPFVPHRYHRKGAA